MSSLDYPKLHRDVKLQPFDTQRSVAVYLLTAPTGGQWQIPAPCYRFLLLLDGTRSMVDLQGKLDAGDFPGLSGCSVGEVFEKFVLSCDLLEGSAVAGVNRPRRKSRSGSRLTLAIPLMRSARLRFITRFTQTAFAHKWAVVSILLIGAILQIISWRLLRSEWAMPARPRYSWWALVGFVLIALLCVVIHELGHLSACHRFGCKAGDVGIGTYLVFPVMYVDLSAAWALPRRERIIIDAGGVYFQFVAASLIAAVHLFTGDITFGLLALGYLISALINFNPLLKLDGYWCLGDWMGIPNLHQEARHALWRTLTEALGWQAAGMRISYRGRRNAFLKIFGLVHVAFFGLLFWSLLLLLPSVLSWFAPSHLTTFVAQLADAPFSQAWWGVVPRQAGHLILSVCILAVVGRTAARVVVKTSAAATRKLRLSMRRKIYIQPGNPLPGSD